jgi:hypothetical protein
MRRSFVRDCTVAVWPGAPAFVGRHPALFNALRQVGLVRAPEVEREGSNPRRFPLPDYLNAEWRAHQNGNMPDFVVGPLVERQDRAIASTITRFLRQTNSLRGVGEQMVLSHVASYRRVYLSNPIHRNFEGTNYTTGVLLYVIAACLAPTFIIESGVWKGLSSFVLSSAAPRARFLAFDINLGNLQYRSPGVDYRECDWTSVDIVADSNSLVYFDDHQNQAARIIEACARGFRNLIFDDSWPIYALARSGWPTLDMVMDDELRPGTKVQWVEARNLWTYVHDEAMNDLCMRARGLVKGAYDFPALYRETGIGSTAATKFMELI